MKNAKEVGMIFSVAVGLCMTAVSGFAHHSESFLDKERLTILKGTITEHLFINPHQIIRFRVTDAKGQTKIWTVQGTGVGGGLKDIGWSKDSLKPGDGVSITFYACKSGRPCGSWLRIVKSDGTELPLPGFKKRFLAEYLQNHGNEISNEEYQIYKKLVTTGPSAVPDPATGPKIVADPTSRDN